MNKKKGTVNIRNTRKIKMSRNDILYYSIAYTIVSTLTLLVIYPLIYIVSASFSTAESVSAGRVWLYPVDFSVYSYKVIFNYKNIYIGYKNTLFYTLFGTFINIIITLMCAYPLSRKNLSGRGMFTFIITFTMLFKGGMIPDYMLIQNLGLYNTVWAMLLPGALRVYNMVIARTFIQNTIPEDLLEASKIDGCTDTQYFIRIILPLSRAIIAVLTLFYAVVHWNSYFNAFLYLTSKSLYPLQIFLRQILVQNNFDADLMDPELAQQLMGLKSLLKFTIIVVATAPLLFIYPFVQKHFVKGVMIGSLKG